MYMQDLSLTVNLQTLLNTTAVLNKAVNVLLHFMAYMQLFYSGLHIRRLSTLTAYKSGLDMMATYLTSED